MKSIIITILLLPVFLFGQSIKRIDGTQISADSLKSKIAYLMNVANVPGVAISVFNNNTPVFSHTFGMSNVSEKKQLTPLSEMYAASFAKMVFAYIVMQMAEEGIVDLDKPLVRYLNKPLAAYKFPQKNQGYQDLSNDDRYKKITARMCLTHTTGFPNWRWFEADNKLKIRFEPGSRYSYSGEGLFLLQFVIEQITGKDYETISQERVFRPLQMFNTSQLWQTRFDSTACYGHNSKNEPYKIAKWAYPNAAGSMTTTLEDFNKFYIALLNGSGLSKKYFTQMRSLQVPIRSIRQFGPLSAIDSSGNDAIQLGYGFGVGVLHSPFGNAFFKEGNDDGWQHYCINFYDQKIAVIIMTNSDNGSGLFKDILDLAIADKYTPLEWENYISYDKR